jgi:hypothetical protein
MEATTVEPSQVEALITDEEFDLMLGELELDAPEHSKTTSTCGWMQHVYCILQ